VEISRENHKIMGIPLHNAGQSPTHHLFRKPPETPG